MKAGMIFALVVLSLFLVACSKTEVIKLNETPSQQQNQTQATPTPTQPAPTASGEKVAVKCDDTDLDDPEAVGKVTVTYSDKSTKSFYDICNDIILTEYICKNNDVATKNYICKSHCYNIKVKDPSCPNCLVGSCFDNLPS